MNLFQRLAAAFVAILAVIGLAIPSIAQQSSTKLDTSRIYQLDEVIISASKYRQDPKSVGRNVTVITHNEIQNSVYTNVSDLLADQQSVHMIGAGQTPGSLQQGFIRNTNANHSIVMIDGVRISDPSTVNNSLDLSELSLAGVERIEIVRGSHSTLYGSSAIGGVINIITQKKGRSGFNANVETKNSLFGEGAYSTSNSIYTNYTSPKGLYTNFGVDQQFTNGMDATIDTVSNSNVYNPQDRDDFRKLDLMGKVGYKNDRFDIYGSYRREDQKVDADQGAYQDDGNAFTEFNRDLFGYGAGAELSQLVHLQFDGAYSELDRHYKNDSSLVSSSGNYDGTYVETNARGSLWENELKTVFEGQFIRAAAGISASRQTMSTKEYVYSSSLFGVYENTTNLDSLGLEEIIYNGYLHTEINGGLLSSKMESLSLVLGGRYVNHNEFGPHFTYEINPKIQVGSSSLIYGAVTSGFNAPSLYQLHSPNKSYGAFTNRGNENLRPEESVSYEVGWKQSLGGTSRFEISLFRTEVDNVIEYVYLWNGDRSIENLGALDYRGDTYVNASRQEINGLEISASTRIFPHLILEGNISLTDSKTVVREGDINAESTGNNHIQLYESGAFITGKEKQEGLTRRPSVNAYLSAGYSVNEDLKFKIDSRFVGKRDDVFYSSSLGPYGALDRSSLSGYNITDLSARYDISDRFSAIGKVENVFNTDYVEIKGYRTRGRGFSLKLQYRFGRL